MKLENLIAALNNSKNATLIVGAGISADMDIPLGYNIPLEFGKKQPDLLKSYSLLEEWEQAINDKSKDAWKQEKRFVDGLVSALSGDTDLQRAFIDWLATYSNFEGVPSDIHGAFATAWLHRHFNHLITTNWDFLLEYQIDVLYEQSYAMPSEPVTYVFESGNTTTIDAERLFFANHLEEHDYFWHPRWDIVAQRSDLDNLERWTRPLWKIHGSPFFLACPKCGGFSRWKWVEPVTVGDYCPKHPEEQLKAEITFWGQGIDTADPLVWRRLQGRIQRSNMIVACGFSGSGSDVYLRSVIEQNDNVWLVNPSIGDWDKDRVKHVPIYAAEFAEGLITQLLSDDLSFA